MSAFVAAEITEPVAGAIRHVQAKAGAGLRPVAPPKLHFTLLFLGQLPEAEAAQAAGLLKRVRFAAFDVSCQGVGSFGRGRVIWAGTDAAGGRTLSGLARAVRAALGPLAPVAKRRFEPHATIFRVKSRAGSAPEGLAALANHRFGVQKISAVKLKRSVAGGSRYEDLAEVRAS